MVTSFHVMNSRMFNIGQYHMLSLPQLENFMELRCEYHLVFLTGQFPYVMLCTTAIFYPPDWPKKLLNSKWLSTEPEKLSSHVISSSKQVKISQLIQCYAYMYVLSYLMVLSYLNLFYRAPLSITSSAQCLCYCLLCGKLSCRIHTSLLR